MQPNMPPKAHDRQPGLTSTNLEYSMDASPGASASVSSAQNIIRYPPSPALQAERPNHDGSGSSATAASDLTTRKENLEPPSGTGWLLMLPRELRDMIYFFALGPGAIRLEYRDLLIDIACPPHEPFDSLMRPSLSDGLYPWMHSSKQVMSEALDVIAEQFIFKLIGFLLVGNEPPCRNRLIFSKGRVRKILILGTFHITVLNEGNLLNINQERLSVDQPHFLDILKELVTENLCLRAEVFLKSERYTHSVVPIVFEESWDRFWDGKFRQANVEIVLHNLVQDPKDVEVLVQRAKTFARQLVGAGSQEMAVKVLPDRILVKHKV